MNSAMCYSNAVSNTLLATDLTAMSRGYSNGGRKSTNLLQKRKRQLQTP